MNQSAIKKEDVAAPSTAAAPVATQSAAAPAATTVGDANKRPAPNGSLASAPPVAKKPNTASASGPTQKSQLQQQIQQQLQQQLQAQLQAAAARGQQANITPEQIQVRNARLHACMHNSSMNIHSSRAPREPLRTDNCLLFIMKLLLLLLLLLLLILFSSNNVQRQTRPIILYYSSLTYITYCTLL